MFPFWLHILSCASIGVGALCAAGLAIDVARRPQPMAVMNVVWPVTALFGSLAVVVFYVSRGRARTGNHDMTDGSMPAAVARGALHCGAGCALGDIISEGLVFAFPALLAVFGLHGLFSDPIYPAWILDFICAFLLGIVFQYFAIAPMRNLSPGQGIVAALKADTASLIAWQVGMYGCMALAQFVVFPALAMRRAEAVMPEFWFAMQIAMLAGFATSYPVNWLLILLGLKEKM